MARVPSIVTTIPCVTIKSAFCFCCAKTDTQNKLITPKQRPIFSLIMRILTTMGGPFLARFVHEKWEFWCCIKSSNSRLDLPLLDSSQLRIRHGPTPINAKALHIAKHKRRYSGIRSGLDPAKLGVHRILKHKRRPCIGTRMLDLDGVYLQPLHVPHKKSMRRGHSKHVRLRIVFLLFRQTPLSVGGSPAARMDKHHVADLHIFNRMPWNPSQNRTDPR